MRWRSFAALLIGTSCLVSLSRAEEAPLLTATTIGITPKVVNARSCVDPSQPMVQESCPPFTNAQLAEMKPCGGVLCSPVDGYAGVCDVSGEQEDRQEELEIVTEDVVEPTPPEVGLLGT